MDKSSNISKVKFIDKIKYDKKTQYLIIGLFIAIIIVFFICNTFFANKSKSSTQNYTLESYTKMLEDKLTNCLCKVSGVGKTSVMINVESGAETVLATEIIKTEGVSGTEIIEKPVVINGNTITIKELCPKIVGVLIVAEGADSISVRCQIQQATSSLLNINPNKIEILTMN